MKRTLLLVVIVTALIVQVCWAEACWKCNRPLPNAAKVCPHCESKQKDRPVPKRKPKSKAETTAFSDEAVVKAIANAKAYIWSQYQADPKEDPWKETHKKSPGGRSDNYGGCSALAIYALLSAGEDVNDPRIKRAIDWLSRIQTKATYTLSLRLQIWSMMPPKLVKKLIARDAAMLINGVGRPTGKPDPKKTAIYGGYGYHCEGKSPTFTDNSNTWFAIWGAETASRLGVNVPARYWRLVYQRFAKTQKPDGGWSYALGGRNVPSMTKPINTMTAAGLLSTLTAYDHLFLTAPASATKGAYAPIARAEKWLAANFASGKTGRAGTSNYLAHVVTRAALAGGLRHIGEKDWYEVLALRLLKAQQADGSFSAKTFSDTPLGLLCLTIGRRPVLFSKLQLPGVEDTRRRDIAMATKWINTHLPVKVAWQRVTFEMDLADWLDAPILYISSRKAPEFTDEQVAKLRQYVQGGGTIFAVRGGGGQAFNTGMKKLYAKLLPDKQLQPCERGHEIYSAQFKLPGRPRLSVIAGDERPLVVHCDTDIAKQWLTPQLAKTNRSCQAAANIFMYVTGGKLQPRSARRTKAKKAP